MNAIKETANAPLRYRLLFVVFVGLIIFAVSGYFTDRRQDHTDTSTIGRLEQLVDRVDQATAANDQEGCAFGNNSRAINREILLVLADELLADDPRLERITELIYKATTERPCDQIPQTGTAPTVP